MNPWLLFLGPIVGVVFPALIPFMVVFALWQLTDGGDKIGVELAHQHRKRHPSPIPVTTGRCALCGAETVRTGETWNHRLPASSCIDPTITKEVAA